MQNNTKMSRPPVWTVFQEGFRSLKQGLVKVGGKGEQRPPIRGQNQKHHTALGMVPWGHMTTARPTARIPRSDSCRASVQHPLRRDSVSAQALKRCLLTGDMALWWMGDVNHGVREARASIVGSTGWLCLFGYRWF